MFIVWNYNKQNITKSMKNTCTYTQYKKYRLISCLKNWFHSVFCKKALISNFRQRCQDIPLHSYPSSFRSSSILMRITREQSSRSHHTHKHRHSSLKFFHSKQQLNKNTLKNSASTIDLEPYVKQLRWDKSLPPPLIMSKEVK